jgi:hypothetical protein
MPADFAANVGDDQMAGDETDSIGAEGGDDLGLDLDATAEPDTNFGRERR